MEPTLTPDVEVEQYDDEELLVHDWRTEQLWLLGLPWAIADAFADRVAWRDVAALVERGCPPELALEIAR